MKQMTRIFWRLYWATPGVFLNPGLYVWAFRRHWRVLPLSRWKQELDW